MQHFRLVPFRDHTYQGPGYEATCILVVTLLSYSLAGQLFFFYVGREKTGDFSHIFEGLFMYLMFLFIFQWPGCREDTQLLQRGGVWSKEGGFDVCHCLCFLQVPSPYSSHHHHCLCACDCQTSEGKGMDQGNCSKDLRDSENQQIVPLCCTNIFHVPSCGPGLSDL